jgi:ankyrin repeat protein
MAAPKLLKKISRQLALEIVHNAFALAREGKIDEAVAELAANNVGPDTFYAGKKRRLLKLIAECVDEKTRVTDNEFDLAFLDKVIDLGCDLDWQDDYGLTCLHYAAGKCSKLDVVRLLLKRGANPNLLSDSSKMGLTLTALGEALYGFNPYFQEASAQIIEALILGGADVNLPYCFRGGDETLLAWMTRIPDDAYKYGLAKKAFFAAIAKRDALRQAQEPETPNA